MLITLALVIGFSLLGLPLLMLRRESREFLLAPTFGLTTSVLIGYAISANFGFSGADSMAVSFGLLMVSSIAAAVCCRFRVSAFLPQTYVFLKTTLLYILPALVILIPAIKIGVEFFFGAVNFDFFYNSQDSVYLSSHSVLEFDIANDNAIFPLTWSANPQGRFAVSLIGAFALKFLGLNPLHFNSALLASLVLISAFAFAAVARSIYRFGILLSSIAVALFIFSGGFAQGYCYYLLGQISALPIFMAVCIYASRAFTELNENISTQKIATNDAVVVIFLLNALYIFYAILSFFAVAVIVGAFFFLIAANKKNALINLRGMTVLAAGSLIVFLLIRVFSLGEAKRTVVDWIVLSLNTAGPSSASSAVFNEYTTESFIPLLFGFFTYPTGGSIFNSLLGAGEMRSWTLFVVGLLILLTFLWALVKVIRRHLMPIGAKAIIGSISTIALICSFIFFTTKSGYAIFKIGNWFIPLLLPLILAAICLSIRRLRAHDIAFIGIGSLILCANTATAINYIFPLLPVFRTASFENVSNLNGMTGVSELKSQLLSKPDRPLIFHLNNGIKNAWIANEFRDRTVTVLTHNSQPLMDKALPSVPCSIAAPSFPKDAVLIDDRGAKSDPDILSINQDAQPFFKNAYYSAYFAAGIDHYAFLGRGSYPATTLGDAEAKALGFAKSFRWIEHGLEIYIFTRKSGLADIAFDATPGFVNGPTHRSLLLITPGIQYDAFFDRKNTRVRFPAIDLKPGMNCLYVESRDEVQPLIRYGALVRPSIQFDSRLLNFALSNINIAVHENQSQYDTQ